MTPDQSQQDADDPFADAFAEAFPGVGQGEDTVPLSAPAPDPGAETQLQALTDRIARELAAAGPAGWQRLDAVFALTLRSETVRVTCTDGTRAVDMPPGGPRTSWRPGVPSAGPPSAPASGPPGRCGA